jgi:hypothetical protein
MSTPYESADLLLRLYEMRREDTLRKARGWFGTFNPQSVQDIVDVIRGEHSAYFRMVTSYWDMAASLVNHGAIDGSMFSDANGEHLFVYAKLSPFLADFRSTVGGSTYLAQVEKLIMTSPDGPSRLEAVKSRIAAMTKQ